MLRDELVLGSHIVVEQNVWERAQVWHVGWRGRFSIAKESWYDYVVLFGVQSLVGSCEPEVIGDC
jgi:hypothetical protein